MDRLTAIVQKLLDATKTQEETALPAQRDPVEVVEVLVLKIGPETYGVPIDHVLEIIRFAEATEVPHTVDFLDGIISLRGEMIPVINGRKRLGQQTKHPDKKTRIVILQEESGRFGIVVDAATQVVHLPKKNMEPPPPVISPGSKFIQGICQHRGQLIILLNLRLFLEFN
jgi:purine-binding chemotaxis protein CheW